MKPGRNDPCPCGSGKKYKSCCLAAERQRSESPADVAWVRVRRAIEGMPRQLGRFVAETYGPAAVEEAWDEFTVWEGRPAFDPESPLGAVFFPWLFHCWEPDPDDAPSIAESLHFRRPTRVFLERRGGRLDALCVRYLTACLEAPFSFHEILRCDRGRGVRMRDVITGREHEVLERQASESMQVGDVVFAQLVPIEGVVLLEACSPYVLPPIDKIRIIELREHIEERERRNPHSGNRLDDWRIEIREAYLQLIRRYLDPRPPTLQNTDGELLKLQSVIFDVDDATAALAALSQAVPGGDGADVERAAGGRVERASFSWIKAGNRAHRSSENTVLGTVELAGTRLVAHVNSDERAQAFREIVARAFGGAVRHIATELTGGLESLGEEMPAAALEAAACADDAAPQELRDLPEVRKRMRQILAQHYETWATTELPALGGRRPIDVLAEPNGREKVDALIAHMERHADAQGDGAGKAALARLRKSLGFAPNP